MKIIIQIGIVFGICLLGEMISCFLPYSFPGSVISMILLFLLLLSERLKLSQIKQQSDFLLHNMAFFFLPTAVSVMTDFDLLKSNLIPFILICFITTVLAFAATAYSVLAVIKIQNKFLERKLK